MSVGAHELLDTEKPQEESPAPMLAKILYAIAEEVLVIVREPALTFLCRRIEVQGVAPINPPLQPGMGIRL